MAAPRHFPSYTEARRDLRAVLDAARRGVVTTIDRDRERYVLVTAEQQRNDLTSLRPARAQVIAEGGGWAVVLPGLPVHGDGSSFDEAIDDAIEALREYAEDWNERLHAVPNHVRHRVVVELVELSTDDQLREWLLATGPGSSGEVATTAASA